MNYVLDTNLISEMVSPKPNPKVIAWVESLSPEQVFLSVITIGELVKGIQKLPDAKRKADLTAWLESDLLVRFQDHLLSINATTMILWGTLIAHLEILGRPMPAIDSLIAATVAEKGFTLATRNVEDFKNTGIYLLNPWETQS